MPALRICPHLLTLCLAGLLGVAPPAARAQDAPNRPIAEAQARFVSGEYQAVVDLLSGLPGRSPDAAYLLGRAHQALQQYPEATAALQQADTTQARVQEALGQSYRRQGQPRRALPYYEAAYRQDSTRQAAALPLAELYAATQAWDKALGVYNRLLRADRDNVQLHYRLGRVYGEADRHEMAISHLERAHQLAPANLQVALRLSRAYMDVDHHISAGRVVDRTLEHHADSPRLWRRRGELDLRDEERTDRAVAAFENVHALTTPTATDHRDLGVAYYLQGRLREARDHLAAALEADDTQGMTAFYLGLTYHELGETGAALEYLQRATQLFRQPLLADVHARMGTVHHAEDRGEDAIRAYRLARQLDPARPDLLFELATLYEAYYADPTPALTHYERFLQATDHGLTTNRQTYAEQRVRALREQTFFEDGRSNPAGDTVHALPTDTLPE